MIRYGIIMSEIKSVSMSKEQAEFVENSGVSLSELVQNEIDKLRKSTDDRRTQLKQEISEIEDDLDRLDELRAQKQNELEALQEELEQLEDEEDDLVIDMVKLCERKVAGDEITFQLQNTTISSDEVEDCFEECVGRTGTETTDEVVAMLRNNGYSEEHLNQMAVFDGDVDKKDNEQAEELVKNNLTPEEQDRVEEWVEDNL
jgi:chromosome segregation ATPase